MLLEFYGTECPHCERMKPLVEQLKKEEGLEVEQHEVWHNEENEKKRQEYDQGFCGGVPFFYNTETKDWLCGSTDYDTFKHWAKGGKQPLFL
jgi:thiol-disulfide isomerase/thioredoxin